MSQWLVLYGKEMLDMSRSYKWLWVPLVFVLLGAGQPIMLYYLPDILKMAGSLPEGAVIQIPTPTPGQTLAETLSQYGTMGVLVLVLAVMGVIAGERQSGAAALVLVKPVPFAAYVTAKWAGAQTLVLSAFAAGYAASWYYTALLIGTIEPGRVLVGGLLYMLWLGFVVTIAVALSAMLKGNGGIAFATIGLVAAVSLLTGLFERYASWSPGTLSGHAVSMLTEGTVRTSLPLAVGVTAAATALLLGLAVRVLRTKELLP